MQAILLLAASNLFMTLAWYGHLKFKGIPLHYAILGSWFIALFEYVLQVPANRIGHQTFTVAELVTIREVISLVFTSIFAIVVLKEQFRWNYLVGFALMAVAVWIIFKK